MKLLGKTDLLVSEVGLGGGNFGTMTGENEAFAILDAYAAAGGNWVDSANIYGKWDPKAGNASETVLGKWLRKTGKHMIIATKGGHPDLSRPEIPRLSLGEIERDLNESLSTLGSDCLDFYWLHRDDPARPVEEILETMETLVKKGKIRYYGASNYTARRLREAEEYANAHGLTGFSGVSNEYSAVRSTMMSGFDKSLVAVSEEEWTYHLESGLPLIPYHATAGGYFSKLAAGGPVNPDGDTEENRRLFARLTEECNLRGCSMQTMTLVETARAAFQILPLTGVRSPEQVKDIADAIRILECE